MKLLIVLALCAICVNRSLASHAFPRPSYQERHRQPHLVASFVAPPNKDVVETHYIEQKLDHFNKTITPTWKMRYISNSGYYKKGGPLFIYVGGEWQIDESGVTTGHIVDIAKKHKGYMLYAEHRFFGLSKPTKDLSVENMKHLNVKQTLADLAHFVQTMKSTIPDAKNSKVIMVGGSYSASLTTWFARTYPQLVDGVWASSNILLAVADFSAYKEGMGQSILAVSGQKCYDRIENSFKQVKKMFEENRTAEVKDLFKVCDNFDGLKQLDISNFFEMTAEEFAIIIQYAAPGDIEAACSYFNGTIDDYLSLASFIRDRGDGTTCRDMTYQHRLDNLLPTNYTEEADRQWVYQNCNELGWFQTSGSTKQPFGNMFSIDFYIKICADVFGKKFTKEFVENQMKATNKLYGGLDPGAVNIYYTQGSLDPWKYVGLSNDTIPLASHTMDLGSESPNDSKLLRASKRNISKLVKQWLKKK